MIAINNVPDHLHFFAGLNLKQSISQLMQLVKGDSSEFINKKQFTPRKFQWQDGYGAFTYSMKDIDNLIEYVKNQKEHHRKETFVDEYKRILKENSIEFDEKYLL